MTMLIALLGAASGIFVALALAISTRLRNYAGSPVAATLINFWLGFSVLLVLLLLGVNGSLALDQLFTQPWWAFLGGVAGSTSVVLSLITIPRLGLVVSTLATICGQLLVSLMIDRFGLLGVSSHAIGGAKILGIALLLTAVILTQLEVKKPVLYSK